MQLEPQHFFADRLVAAGGGGGVDVDAGGAPAEVAHSEASSAVVQFDPNLENSRRQPEQNMGGPSGWREKAAALICLVKREFR